MSNPEFKNVVVFVSDALRYDYVPGELLEKGCLVPTLAPSLHTPTSFASFFSARSPENHNIRGFLEELNPEYVTAFDFFENCSFYDGDVSTIRDNIFKTGYQELENIEEPFIWIERMMETHLIYGKMGHDRDYEYKRSGQELFKEDKEGKIDIKEEYQKGSDAMLSHFNRHIQELEDRGLLEDTLIILTSDHGELIGEKYLGRTRYDHNMPPLKEIVQVPTVFYNYDPDIESMRMIDVLPTALSIAGKDVSRWGDGVDARKEEVTEGRNIMKHMPYLQFNTRWRFKDGEWRPTAVSRLTRGIKTALTDMANLFYSRGKQLEKRIEKENKNRETQDELEDIDI